jgi:hypothetical protein
MTRIGRNAVTTAVFVLVLGCAAPEQGAAQDAPPKKEERQAEAKKGEAEKPKRRFLATVQDKFQPDAFQLHGAVLFVPEVSLFGGGGGEEKQLLVVKRGAAEIQCPFERIEKLEVPKDGVDEEHLKVKVSLRASGDAPAEVIEGTVRSSLLLKGTFGRTQLVTEVKLREVLTVTLAEER